MCDHVPPERQSRCDLDLSERKKSAVLATPLWTGARFRCFSRVLSYRATTEKGPEMQRNPRYERLPQPELPPDRKPNGAVTTSARMLLHERMALEKLRDLIGTDDAGGRPTISEALRTAVSGELERRKASHRELEAA